MVKTREDRVARVAGRAAGVALLLFQNKAVTGSWTTLPYALSRYQYGVPNALTFQASAVPHRTLTASQQNYYEGQSAVHGHGDTVARYLDRLGSRAGFYRFFFLTPLLLAVPFFLLYLRNTGSPGSRSRFWFLPSAPISIHTFSRITSRP